SPPMSEAVFCESLTSRSLASRRLASSATICDLPTPGLPHNITESLSGHSALMAEIASEGGHDIVLIIKMISSVRGSIGWVKGMTNQTHFVAFRSLFKRSFNADLTSAPHIQSLSLVWAARFPAGGIDPMRA